MILNYNYSGYAAGISKEQIENDYLESFRAVMSGEVYGAEDNFLDVVDKHGTQSFGNIVYFRENGRINGVFCYGDDDAGEDFVVDFDYPEEKITSFRTLLDLVSVKADEEQE